MKKVELEQKIKLLELQITTMQTKYEKLLNDYDKVKYEIDTYKGNVEDIENSTEYKIGKLISTMVNNRIIEHDYDVDAHSTVSFRH